MSSTTTTVLGGYALTKLTSMRGDEGLTFRATLTRDGVELGEVSNSGRGDSNLYRFADRSEHQRLIEFATAMNADAFEPEDVFIQRLAVVRTLNRSRCVAFLLEGDDPFVIGTYHSFTTTTTFDAALRHLVARSALDAFAPLIWVKDRSQFVPVTDLVAR